jgi:type III pantothenate kinase
MILVVDVGNSRMKWALYDPRGWLVQGALPNADIGTLALRDWQNLPRPVRAVGVNVAGEAARVRVEGQLTRWRLPMEWMHGTPAAAGVVNGYARPEQLGPDRWASLVAARRRALMLDGPPPACVVINAGTAVTIDALDADGVFQGGLILPGIRLMTQALADNTAALKVPAGTFAHFPTNTSDAIYSGAVQAVCGAAELLRLKIGHEGRPVHCFLAGGTAQQVGPYLSGPVEVVDNLVLEGVLLLASEQA